MRATIEARRPVQFDEDGLLVVPGLWNERLAMEIARQHDIGELTEAHWKVIHSLRQHYERFGAPPAMIQICRIHGQDRHWVHDLFHTCLNAWRVAGLPNPGEEAKAYLNDM
jgi:TusE/DsrC/DsvC family sulfur relay protein